jgi:four helix bundle protein
MKDFRKIVAWQKAHQMVLAVYRATATFPKAELYGLTSQLRRASTSVPANIAEGCGRRGEAELARFCDISLGSASEVQYHLLLARDLNFLQTDEYEALDQAVTEVKRMLTGFVQKLKADR